MQSLKLCPSVGPLLSWKCSTLGGHRDGQFVDPRAKEQGLSETGKPPELIALSCGPSPGVSMRLGALVGWPRQAARRAAGASVEGSSARRVRVDGPQESQRPRSAQGALDGESSAGASLDHSSSTE